MLSIILSSQANIFWTGDSSFWCLFIDANLTAYDSNIGVQIYWYMFWFRPVSLIRLGLYEIVQSMDRKQTINGEGIYSFFFCWLLISISLSISLSRKNILFLICKHIKNTEPSPKSSNYLLHESLYNWNMNFVRRGMLPYISRGFETQHTINMFLLQQTNTKNYRYWGLKVSL